MTIFAGVVEIVLSRFLHRLRPVFPPVVSGFVVCIVGIGSAWSAWTIRSPSKRMGIPISQATWRPRC
jgi:xanthine/uracil permease